MPNPHRSVSAPMRALRCWIRRTRPGPAFFMSGSGHILKEVPKHGKGRRAGEDHPEMLRVQAAQLCHQQKQEEYPRPSGAEQVLPLLQKAYRPQRDEVMRLQMAERKEG